MRMRLIFRKLIVSSVLVVALLLQGFWGLPSSKAQSASPPIMSGSDPVLDADALRPPAEDTLSQSYFYDPQGRPDPFQPFLSMLTAALERERKFLPPLQRSNINEFELIAVIWGAMGQSAMLRTPDGKGYTIEVGARIGPNQGVVKRITRREVVIVERYRDLFGRDQSRKVVMKLRSMKEKP